MDISEAGVISAIDETASHSIISESLSLNGFSRDRRVVACILFPLRRKRCLSEALFSKGKKAVKFSSFWNPALVMSLLSSAVFELSAMLIIPEGESFMLSCSVATIRSFRFISHRAAMLSNVSMNGLNTYHPVISSKYDDDSPDCVTKTSAWCGGSGKL